MAFENPLEGMMASATQFFSQLTKPQMYARGQWLSHTHSHRCYILRSSLTRPGCLPCLLVLSCRTLEEMEELCRDEESSGCDVDTMDALMAAEAKKNRASRPAKPRWSKEIDEAVVKTD